jgi:hypothetical protein
VYWNKFWVFYDYTTVTRKLSGGFVRFRAPLQTDNKVELKRIVANRSGSEEITVGSWEINDHIQNEAGHGAIIVVAVKMSLYRN